MRETEILEGILSLSLTNDHANCNRYNVFKDSEQIHDTLLASFLQVSEQRRPQVAFIQKLLTWYRSTIKQTNKEDWFIQKHRKFPLIYPTKRRKMKNRSINDVHRFVIWKLNEKSRSFIC